MKKLSFIIILVFTINILSLKSFAISAKSAVLIDADTGRVLYEHNADEKRGMASTTKIMTAITAIENADVNKVITVSSTASGVEGSSMYLAKGEKLTLKELLYGLMLVSGNDAATAVAEAVAGSVPSFAELMNKKAYEIGASSTNFTNPHGLSDDNHYTTAYDLAKITAYALKNSQFAEIVASKAKKLPQNDGGYARTLVNHNKFLNMYDGCIGVKTGFTKATGRCLVTAVEKNGMKLICVTLNASDDWNDHKYLYDSVLAEYSPFLIKAAGEKVADATIRQGIADTVSLVVKNDISIPLKSGEEQNLEFTPRIFEDLKAPVSKGDILGMLAVSVDGKPCGEFPLAASADIAEKKLIFKNHSANFPETFKKTFYLWLTCFQ